MAFLLPFIIVSAIFVVPAQAVTDEIQVYTDEINAPGEKGLELHINATPKGRRIASYPGELVPNGGMRITPEFSYGLTETLEAGLYLPFATNANLAPYFGGPKFRLKWLPIHGGEGFYAGLNAELSSVARKFEEVGRAHV